MPKAFALAQNQSADKARNTGINMHNGATGKIGGSQPGQPANRAPDPMRNRRIDQQGPEDREDAHGTELHAFCIRARNQGRGDDGERHLEHHEEALGNRHRRSVGRICTQREGNIRTIMNMGPDPVQEQAGQATNPGRSSGEGQRIPGNHPDNRHDAAQSK